MKASKSILRRVLATAGMAAALCACGGAGEGSAAGVAASVLASDNARAAAMALPSYGPNMVTRWSDVATATVNIPAAATGSPQEKRPLWPVDLGSVHVAMYDAAVAFTRTHRPFAVEPQATTQGASADAAVLAAGYGVLRGLFPNRSAVYQPAYDALLLQLPDDEARARGLALGEEVAVGVLAVRGGEDGRSTALPPFVPGTGPGQYRGPIFANRFYPFMKPFAIERADQFRAEGPPPLASDIYAADFAEVRDLGRSDSQLRTADQTATARFHSEPVNTYYPRNFNRFASSQASLADNARLAAMLYVSLADTQLACTESKAHYLFWRPTSAIQFADTDGNDVTVADATWTSLLAVTPFPDYPSENSCGAGSIAEVLTQYFGTKKVSFVLDSRVTNTTRTYETVAEMEDEVFMSRIWGGVNFRTSLAHGRVLGMQATKWVLRHQFQVRN